MSNNTQRRIQVTLKHYDHNQSLVWTYQPQNPNNHIKIFKHNDNNQALVFYGLSPHNNI